MQSHLTLSLTPTPGERELEKRIQHLIDNATSEPDLVSGKVAEVWRCLGAQSQDAPLLQEVRVTLGHCRQIAELVDQAASPTFKPLETHTEAMQQLVNRVRVADVELQPLSVPLQQLADVYQQALASMSGIDGSSQPIPSSYVSISLPSNPTSKMQSSPMSVGLQQPLVSATEPKRWNKQNIANQLWENSDTIISDEMVAKVNHTSDYLRKIGYDLAGVKADGNCFFGAFFNSYRALMDRKIPLLDAVKDPISYLRTCVADQYERSPKASSTRLGEGTGRIDKIKTLGEWVTAEEGRFLALALKIPIRLLTINHEASTIGMNDMLASMEANQEMQDWSALVTTPTEFIFIVDVGGHFLWAKKTSGAVGTTHEPQSNEFLTRQALVHMKANPTPLTCKARLFVPGMGHYLISQEVARKLASKTFEGDNLKGISSGSNFVAHLHGVFYKRNPFGENAFSPALEAAVVSFHELLGGGSAAPTGCLKLRDVAFKEGVDKQEYVLQAGLGTYGVSLDGMLSLQQWVAVFEAVYGDTRGVEALLEPRLMDEVKRDYGAMFRGGDVDIPTLLKLVFAEISSHPKDLRLFGFQGLDISEEREKIDFEQTIREVGPLAGAWVFALICRYPKVMLGLRLGHLLNWYKAKEWLSSFMPDGTLQAKVTFVKQWQQALDKDNSALAVLSTLLTLPKDGRADNYMVAIEAGALKFVSIDNDISLHAPYHAGSHNTYTKLLSVLLLLKEVMSQTLAEGVRLKLLARSPEDWILEWLKNPVAKEREFIAWQQEKLLHRSDIEACGVCDNPYPCGIEPKAVELMYVSLQKLWGLLKAQPKVTLNQVFEALYPTAYAHYQAIQKRGLDPMRAYHQVEQTPLEETGAVDRSQLPIFYVKQRPLVESVACLAKLFPWSEGDERVLFWLDQIGRMGPQETCLPKELAQSLLPLAIKMNLPGAVRVLCAHDVSSIIDTKTQQTVFHLFAHTYVDDKLTDDEALVIWKSLLAIKGGNINSHDAGETLPAFTLLNRMIQKVDRGAALLLEAMKQGLDLTLKYKDETLLMRAFRLAETEVRFRPPLHRLIALGGAKGVPLSNVVHYLTKSGDARCQELLVQYEPSVAWHFTLNALAPTAVPKETSFKAKTPTEMRYFTKAMIGRCPAKFQEALCGSSLSSSPPAERYGRHLVFPYVEGMHTVHMKVNPEIPGYEYAFQQLASLFFDEELPQHTLFKLELSSWFSRALPVLWSQTVPGENLQTLYKKDPLETHQRLSQLDAAHVSRLICLTLLGFTEDGKPDNFILQGQRLISIDNDHAFIDAVTYPIRNGIPQPQLNLKSIVFCLDQMRHPLHPQVVARIKNWHLAECFKSWLDKLHAYHEAIKTQFGMTSDDLRAWSEAPVEQTRIGILFEGRSFLDLYDRACRLQKCLSEKPKMSGFELLRELLPTTYPFYERAFAHPHPLDRFFQGIAEGRYTKSTGGSLTTQSNPVTFFSLKQLPKGSSLCARYDQ